MYEVMPCFCVGENRGLHSLAEPDEWIASRSRESLSCRDGHAADLETFGRSADQSGMNVSELAEIGPRAFVELLIAKKKEAPWSFLSPSARHSC